MLHLLPAELPAARRRRPLRLRPQAAQPRPAAARRRCVRVQSGVGGIKGAGDVDDIACSSSVSFAAPIYLISEIRPVSNVNQGSFTECSVKRADNGEHASTLAPCRDKTTVSLVAKVPYHACVETQNYLHGVSVGFKWFLTTASRRRKRDLGGEETDEGEAQDGEILEYEIWHNETEGKGSRPCPHFELRIGNRTELL
ncbi:hypothetical protein BKA80DRAFT_277318 [Phyllosticta citrichinensis]